MSEPSQYQQPQYPPGQYAQQPYPQQGYPQQGYPQPPYQQPSPYQQPARRPGTNGFAVAALVFGILGGVLLSVIFGIVALVQIRRTGQKGRGMAIAGLVLSGLWIVAIVTAVAVAIATSAERNPSGEITSAGSVPAMELKVGDCLNGLQEGKEVTSVPAVPCAQLHEGEVFAVFNLPDGSWPGESNVATKAEDGCNNRLQAYAPKAAKDDSIGLFTLQPTQTTWADGDRAVTCVAASTPKRTGSIKE